MNEVNPRPLLARLNSTHVPDNKSIHTHRIITPHPNVVIRTCLSKNINGNNSVKGYQGIEGLFRKNIISKFTATRILGQRSISTCQTKYLFIDAVHFGSSIVICLLKNIITI